MRRPSDTFDVRKSAFYTGDCRALLNRLPERCVQTCITSPPYWGLRDYGHRQQIGLESTPERYVAKIITVMRGVRRALCDDGTVWLNLGDSYAGSPSGPQGEMADREVARHRGMQSKTKGRPADQPARGTKDGLKHKDLVGIPWMVAFALRADGWYLRQDIIWHKPNPMPESVVDRCTKAHEYIFLLSKGDRYYYNADAIAEPANSAGKSIRLGSKSFSKGQATGAGRDPVGNGTKETYEVAELCNKRSVWTVASQPYTGAHFAVFPPRLIEPCVLAGSRPGDLVLDPFFGSGTTGEVAEKYERRWIGFDINPAYANLAKERTAQRSLPLHASAAMDTQL